MSRPRYLEYEFTMPDGSKRYEFVDGGGDRSATAEVMTIMKALGAKRAQPVSRRCG